MKPIYCFGGLMLLAAAFGVAAEPSSRVAWTLDTLRLVENGDPAKGKQVAQSCEICHAATPENVSNGYPLLRGQRATYLYKQLRDYKDKTRPHDIMTSVVSGLSEQAMADVAAYYSREAAPAWQKPDGLSEAGPLVDRGDGRRILPPCRACHESNGQGQKIDIPALAGQNAAYLEQTLQAYKSGARHNDLYGRMRTLTQPLSDAEIKQLARYYAGSGR